jgi:hypothetical protein
MTASLDGFSEDLAEKIDSSGAVWALPDDAVLLCPVHHTDQPVAHVEPEMEVRPVHVADGKPVDGMIAVPEHITAKVST